MGSDLFPANVGHCGSGLKTGPAQ